MKVSGWVGWTKFDQKDDYFLDGLGRGMAAVSSGILIVWLDKGVPQGDWTLLALSLMTFSIPLLVLGSIFRQFFSKDELIRKRTLENIHALTLWGIIASVCGYQLLIRSVSIWLSNVFIIGTVVGGIAFLSIMMSVDKDRKNR